MQKNTLLTILDAFKGQSLTAILGAILLYYGSTYTESLAQIQKQIVEIRVQLASINQKYAQKSAVRELIDQKIAQHLQLFHSEKNSSNK